MSLPFGQKLLFCYLLVITVITFFAFGMDKLKAQVDARRTGEKTLWVLSLLGGSVGALLGMYFFRHKTKKVSFQAGMAVVLTVQILLIWLLLSR